MSFIKKNFIVVVALVFVFIFGCNSNETQQKPETKLDVEQEAQEPAAESGIKELKPQTICPVMGGKIDKKLYVDMDGKRIYICCEHCREELTKNFGKYVKKLEEELGQKAEML